MVKDMTAGSPAKLIVRFALPLMLGNLFQQFYSMVDAVIVGRYLGKNPLAAVGSTSSLNFLIIGFCLGLCAGFAIPVAQRFGAKETDELRRFVGNIVWLAVGFSVLLVALTVVLCRPMLLAMSTPPDIIDDAYRYIVIIFAGIPATFFYNILASLLRALGDSKTPVFFLVLAAVLNIGLDLLLVVVLPLGVSGAAIATVAAQACSVVFAVILLMKKQLPFEITKKDFRLNIQCQRFLEIGLPLALQEFLTQISFLALCAFVNRLGLEASSGYGVACKIVNFAMLVPSALMQSMASFVSQNVGAGKLKRARQSMLTGIGVGLVVGCFVFALVMLKGDVLTGFFSTDEAVIQNGFAYLKGFAPETIVTAVLFSMIGYFNGNNKTVWVMTQGLIQTLLIRLPFAYIMSIQPNASLTMIGLAALVSTMVGIILNVGFFT